jgi:hypothetical protein
VIDAQSCFLTNAVNRNGEGNRVQSRMDEKEGRAMRSCARSYCIRSGCLILTLSLGRRNLPV